MKLFYLPLKVHGGCEGCPMRPHCQAIVNTREPLACEMPDEPLGISQAQPTRPAHEWLEPKLRPERDWWRERETA